MQILDTTPGSLSLGFIPSLAERQGLLSSSFVCSSSCSAPRAPPEQQHQSHLWLEAGGQPYGITAQALAGLQSVAYESNDSAMAKREGW